MIQRVSWLLGVMFVAGVSAAQAPPRVVPQDVLEGLTQLECRFSTSARGNWRGVTPDAPVIEPARLDLSITDIDVMSGTATTRIEGRATSVSARSDRSNLFFLDLTSGDTALLTTVFSQQTEDGGLKAVHVRSGRSPAQLVGDCRMVR